MLVLFDNGTPRTPARYLIDPTPPPKPEPLWCLWTDVGAPREPTLENFLRPLEAEHSPLYNSCLKALDT
jgi:hypothetical protein